MKIVINNKTDLSFKKIGELCDEFIKENSINFIYEVNLFNYKKIEYRMIIEYKKNQINVIIEEVNVLAKKISKKGLRFPKLK